MKILVLSLAMLCLTGTHGLYIEQQNAAQPARPGVKESLRSLIRHTYVLGAEIVANLESSEESSKSELNDRLGMIVTSAHDLGSGVLDYIRETCADVDKEISDQYPVYRKTVFPIVGEFVGNISTMLIKLKTDLQPYVDEVEIVIKKQQLQLWKHFHTVIRKDAKVWKAAVDNLVARLKPFEDGVRKELDAARKQEASELSEKQETAKANHEEVDKFREALMTMFYEEEGLEKVMAQLEEYYKNNVEAHSKDKEN
ncbi:apolipoprotein A-IV-like [Pseudophryne corroboree]|uniref:apolipoprotein A-IV-like n=1 Tax=Pseudophryne corroboree TaxID=495146 RepID=UPI003081855B